MKSAQGSQRPLPRAPLVSLLLVALISATIIWLISSGTRFSLFFSLLGIAGAVVYFGLNFEKTYIPFILVIALPLAVFVTAVHRMAYELVIPGLFLLLIIHGLVSQSAPPVRRILPWALIIFYALGLFSYLRNPSMPTQVFARSVDLGSFRNYWHFFLGLMTYLLAFYLFRKDRSRKAMVLIKLLTGIYTVGLLFHLAMTYFRINTPAEFILMDWGPAADGGEAGGMVFQSWTLAWYGLHLFLILIAFPGFPKKRTIKGFLFLLSLTCIVLSGARAALLAAAAAIIISCLLKKKFVLILFPLLALVCVLVVSYAYPQFINSLPRPTQRILTIFPTSAAGHRGATVSALTRIIWWREAMGIIGQHPWMGIGFEQLGHQALYLDYTKYAVRIGSSHNAYIATGVMLGIPGMAVLLWIFILHLNRGLILLRRAGSGFENDFNLWLTLVLFSFVIIYLFAGSPQSLFRYLIYAGLINLNWRIYTGEVSPSFSLKDGTGAEKAESGSRFSPDNPSP